MPDKSWRKSAKKMTEKVIFGQKVARVPDTRWLNVTRDTPAIGGQGRTSMPEKPSYEELERRLLESERLIKESNAIFELSPDIVGIGNLDGFFIKVNSAFEKLTGYTKEELYERPFLSFIHEKDVERTCYVLDELQKGKQFLNIEYELQSKFFFDYVHPDDLALTKKEMEKLGQGQTTFYFENRCRHKNGSYRLLAWSAIASLEDQLVYAVASDITERRPAETSFQKSTEELNHILNTAMDGFCLFDHAGRFIKVNETYCQMSGYNEQELLSMSIVDMEGLKTGGKVTKQVEKILELGENRFESLLRRKDGSLIDVELSVQYSERDGGRLIAFVRDITKQKKARKEVWESREKFRSLVELTSDWIWEVDRNGTYTYSSPQIKRLLGYQPQDLVGKMTPFDLMSADEAKKISALFIELAATDYDFKGIKIIRVASR